MTFVALVECEISVRRPFIFARVVEKLASLGDQCPSESATARIARVQFIRIKDVRNLLLSLALSRALFLEVWLVEMETKSS
jgi:hypothetical protein